MPILEFVQPAVLRPQILDVGFNGDLGAGDALDQFRENASKEREVKNIETYNIQKVKPLFDAIKQPYRLIPLENQGDLKDIKDFISLYQLYGLRKLFYVPSTRGVFKCQVLEAGAAQR